MKSFEMQVQAILEMLKKCYIERDKNNIANLSALLFQKDCFPIIIGTSNDEWCFGFEESEELFISDWEGWGNVSVDVTKAVYAQSGTYGWFYVPAGVEYCFDDNDDSFAAFMEMSTEIVATERTPLSKAGEIIWLLSHLLHSRTPSSRKYKWDMTISGVLMNRDSVWKIKHMQFSIPVLSAYSDVRMEADPDNIMQYDNECKKISGYNAAHTNDMEIVFFEQITKLFDDDNRIRFMSDDIQRYIGLDGVCRNGVEQKSYLSTLLVKGVIVRLPIENIIFTRNDNHFSFCGVGVFSRNISMDSELNEIFENINHYTIIESKKEGLFNLRRDLSHVIKVASLSSRLTEPFRIEVVGSLFSENIIMIEYMQVSYPFNCILEQKTDASKIIDNK